MSKESKRIFLSEDDYDSSLLPTDYEPILKIMGINIDRMWSEYEHMIKKLYV